MNSFDLNRLDIIPFAQVQNITSLQTTDSFLNSAERMVKGAIVAIVSRCADVIFHIFQPSLQLFYQKNSLPCHSAVDGYLLTGNSRALYAAHDGQDRGAGTGGYSLRNAAVEDSV
jgi:hypothetical protein